MLICGETGTGKELVARSVHRSSPRRRGPFVAVNCAGLSQELAASELWGHVTGAFTDAVTDRRGHVASAEGGTLFLDEVGTLDPEVQAQLLRFLQEGEYTPLGSSETRTADVRVVCATNLAVTDPLVREATSLREDLFFRLRRHLIRTVPLREMVGANDGGDDFERLVDNAVQRHNSLQLGRGTRVDGVERAVVPLLRQHEWPGNVRELNSIIASACSEACRNANRILLRRHVQEELARTRRGRTGAAYRPHLRRTLKELHKDYRQNPGDPKFWQDFVDAVNKYMNQAGGVLVAAARLAGVSRQTMARYVREAKDLTEGAS